MILHEIFLIIVLGIISYCFDLMTSPNKYYEKCISKTEFHTKLILHHILVIFIYFGWLSNNTYILSLYLLIPIILLIHWKMNDNRCVMTETINNMCGLDKDEYIRDVAYLCGLKKSSYYDPIYKTFLVFTFFITSYKLYSKI